MKDMEKLVNKLNEAAKNYYSESEITKMSDHEYDQLYDELVAMEKETGVVLPDSPTFNASEVAHSIQKSDGIIPGIRSGQNTVAYLKRQMKSLIFIGAICMSIIAMVPIFISAHYGLSRLSFLGTSVIITVSVITDTKNQVLSQRRSKKYIARTV